MSSIAHRVRHPQTTVRWRLTLLYGGLFLICGAALLAVTYELVAHATVTETRQGPLPAFLSTSGRTPPNGSINRGQANFTIAAPKTTVGGSGAPAQQRSLGGRKVPAGRAQIHTPPTPGQTLRKLLRTRVGERAIGTFVTEQRIADLHQLELWSVIALAIMAVLSAALGWVVAGRVLAPLVTITETARQISEANLHERLAMDGPRDELRLLADTIDGLLQRLQGAFDAQRRFVANASHELRTPLTATRALLEMVLTDPDATVDTFREVCGQVLEEGEQQEQLISALLALAHGQRGVDRRERFDLANSADEVVHAQELHAVANGLRLDVSLEQAPIAGDRKLVERLISNLLENAIRHNVPGGSVRLRVANAGGAATLSVANTGPLVQPEEVERLLQPFQRLGADRVGHREGLGLGLSIVAAIATAHNATLDVRPGSEGGLDIGVRFPRAPETAPTRAPTGQPEPAPAVV